jgi:transcriptional regulator with XRE-family HTH domain
MSHVSHEHFREALHELMEQRGWSQRDLCTAVGVDPAHICRLLKRESRVRASPELLARIARACDVSPEFFVEYREWCVLEAVRSNPTLRERLYARLAVREPVA